MGHNCYCARTPKPEYAGLLLTRGRVSGDRHAVSGHSHVAGDGASASSAYNGKEIQTRQIDLAFESEMLKNDVRISDCKIIFKVRSKSTKNK